MSAAFSDSGIPNKPRRESWWFAWLCQAATWSSVVILIVLLLSVAWKAWGWVDWQFLTSYDSRKPEQAGVLAGILGSTWLILFTILFSVPLGIGAAIYLEEYASDTLVNRIIRVNLANLAGVPSIVYGILGVTLFVRAFGIFDEGGLVHEFTGQVIEEINVLGVIIPIPLGKVVIAGAMTLTLLILPVIIIASQEALRAVPPSIRTASLALGATRWQTVWYQVLPAALPGIMTGIILAISRAIGETAPLVCLGIALYVNYAPGSIDSVSSLVEHPQGLLQAPFDTFTVLPYQIYNWVRDFRSEPKSLAAAGILVMLCVLFILNGLAILIRNRSNRNVRW